MSKVSPARNSFNGGEFSALVEGRTDIDRYPASMRKMVNFIAAPQGPAMRRSGTYFMGEVNDSSQRSALVPFIFSETEALQIEFGNEVVRFMLETGLQTYTARDITNITQLNPFQFDSATLDALVGDQVAIDGFPASHNINGRVLRITAKVGTNYTVDYDYSVGTLGASAGTTGALLYSIAGPYLSADTPYIRSVQSVDVVYLFCAGYKPRKLSRYNSYDWRMAILDFTTGPFMPEAQSIGTLTLSGTGSPVTGGTASASSGTAASAFDNDPTTYWQCVSNQAGWIQYQFATPVVIDGYAIVKAKENSDGTYAATDYAPGDFNFLGSNDGATWYLLDAQRGYILYDTGRSVLFKCKNTTAYTYYRLDVLACTRNGAIGPRIAELVLKDAAAADISIVLSGAYDDINYGQGFVATDVGRLIRVKGGDQTWRVMRVATYTDATHITATLIDEPFPSNEQVLHWQLGYWSDTTGYPSCGAFFEDRMYVGGTNEAPDLIAGSRVGSYEDFTQRSPDDEVLDDNAIVVRLNNRRLSGIRWLATDERGLLIGTGSGEWVLTPIDVTSAITSRNIKARNPTERGSANIEPVKVDSQVLYVQASGRTVREYAYVYQADGYKSPSMSLFASHLGVKKFAQMSYASEPHAIVWFRREDGSVVAMTYNREENVVGWHQHDFGGVVESISVTPSSTTLQDTLWIIVQRTVGGASVRYIEKLTRFWDFDSVIEDAHFVDCGLKYDGAATDTVYGLWHLEGETLHGLRDGIPFDSLVVTGGALTVPDPALKIIAGLQFVSEGEISRIEAGAADGTAQGKTKRINNVTAFLWQSAYGEVGKWNDDQKVYEWLDIEYDEPFDELQPVNLQDGMFGPLIMPPGYGKRGSISFRQTKPLPFNIVSLLPQMNTQDRG